MSPPGGADVADANAAAAIAAVDAIAVAVEN